MPDHSVHSRRRLRAMVTVLATAAAAIAGCGTAVSGTSPAPSTSTSSSTGAEDLRSRAEAVPGIDEARLVYVDADGSEHPGLPADADDSAGWVARIDLVHDIRGGAAWASETVDGLVQTWPESGAPLLEIWLDPTSDVDVSALAYPLPADGGDPVRDAYLMAATPGVVRSVFDGRAGEVRVRDESDLAKVADVAVAQGVQVDAIQTADGDAALEVATVPARPAVVDVPSPWPDDPAAPQCAPEVLHLTLAGADAATGHRGLTVSATNTGSTPCAVEGYPELGFRSIDERPLDVTVTLGGSFMGRDPGAARVVIPPGARVLAIAGWNAMSTAGADDVTAEVLVAATPGTPTVELPLTSFALSPEQAAEDDLGLWRPITSLDILDTGEVSVTAWAPHRHGLLSLLPENPGRPIPVGGPSYPVPMELEFSGELWFWRGPAPWHFVTVPDDHCDTLDATAALVSYGWGMIPCTARIGTTTWTTSMYPKDGRYLVPVKAAVRRSEGLEVGDTVTVQLGVDA